MNDLNERVRQILHRPTWGALCGSPTPMALRPEILIGDIQVGDRLMHEVGLAHHTKSLTILSGDDIESKPELTLRTEYFGFWRMSAQCVLFLHDEFRKEFPVWAFSIHGQFNERVIKERDTSAPDLLLDTLIRSGKQVFAMREVGDNTFNARAPSYSHENISYTSTLEGDWQSFVGSEELVCEGESLWSAWYSGMIVTPRNAPP
jgi:hypothetical protein